MKEASNNLANILVFQFTLLTIGLNSFISLSRQLIDGKNLLVFKMKKTIISLSPQLQEP